MNAIIKVLSNINKLNNSKRILEPYHQYIKLKINKIGKINIFGELYYQTSEIYFNGKK